MRTLSLLTALFLTASLPAQSVTLPDTTTGVPGQWIVLAPLKVDGGAVKYRFDPALQEVHLGQLLPDEYVSKLKGKVVTATEPGRYKYEAWNAKGDVASDIAVGWVVILGKAPTPIPPPPIPPAPDPKPPTPTPSPSPIPVQGLRVLVVYEATGGSPLLTRNQMNELYGAELATFLTAKCAKGPDGKTAEFRIWDKDTPLGNASQLWKDAMARPRAKTPWILISNGTSGYEGELPDGGILTLVRRYAP